MSDQANTTGDSENYSDVHVHLQSTLNPYGAQELLIQGRRAGIDRFVCSGTSPNDWDDVVLLAHGEPDVYPSFGVHPWYVDALDESWKARLWRLCTYTRAANGRRPAVGEIGLDFSLRNANKPLQEKIFNLQLDLAIDQELPVIVHCVRASGAISSQIERLGRVRLVLFHGFSESKEIVKQWSKYDNFYFSFSAENILSPSPRVLAMLQAVPLDRILFETDQPGPLRNKQPSSIDEASHSNIIRTPALIGQLVQTLARLRKVDTNDFVTAIRRNGDRFFAAWPLFSIEGVKP
ncbi:MAG: TatD family hydrolase [Planctomycetia bacterium]|nr:TatD family hydrolase [Planctomycetia bacterium]